MLHENTSPTSRICGQKSYCLRALEHKGFVYSQRDGRWFHVDGREAVILPDGGDRFVAELYMPVERVEDELDPKHAGICDGDDCPHDAAVGRGPYRLCRTHAAEYDAEKAAR